MIVSASVNCLHLRIVINQHFSRDCYPNWPFQVLNTTECRHSKLLEFIVNAEAWKKKIKCSVTQKRLRSLSVPPSSCTSLRSHSTCSRPRIWFGKGCWICTMNEWEWECFLLSLHQLIRGRSMTWRDLMWCAMICHYLRPLFFQWIVIKTNSRALQRTFGAID